MKHSCRYFQALLKFGFLLTVAVTWVAPAWGQNDLQIIVDGPWSYHELTDASGHWLDLILPDIQYHSIYIDVGVDIAKWKTHPNQAISKGFYQLAKFENGNSQPVSGVGSVADLIAPNVCGDVTIDPTNAIQQSKINQPTDYVIRLPYPERFSTYEDRAAAPQWDGVSEAKVYPNSLGSAVSRTTPAQLMTTTMDLHYWMQNNSAVNLGWSTQNGSATLLPGASVGGGITIVATMPPPPHPQPYQQQCDSLSVMSANARNGLFGVHHQMLFPELLDNIHQTHHYDYADCNPSGLPAAGGSGTHAAVSETKRDHEENPPEDERGNLLSACDQIVSACVTILSPTGTGDCHTCQLSINGAVH